MICRLGSSTQSHCKVFSSPAMKAVMLNGVQETVGVCVNVRPL